MERFRVAGLDWTGAKVELATSFLELLRGIRGVSAGFGIVMKKRSVHTFGLEEALWGIGIDRDGTVLTVKPMLPERLFYFSGACYVLELPEAMAPPSPGDEIWLMR